MDRNKASKRFLFQNKSLYILQQSDDTEKRHKYDVGILFGIVFDWWS